MQMQQPVQYPMCKSALDKSRVSLYSTSCLPVLEQTYFDFWKFYFRILDLFQISKSLSVSVLDTAQSWINHTSVYRKYVHFHSAYEKKVEYFQLNKPVKLISTMSSCESRRDFYVLFIILLPVLVNSITKIVKTH